MPLLTATGVPSAGAPVEFEVTGAAPGALVRLIAGGRLAGEGSAGVVVAPDGSFRLRARADAQGKAVFQANWPEAHVPGFPVFVQAVVGEQPGGITTSRVVSTIGEPR